MIQINMVNDEGDPLKGEIGQFDSTSLAPQEANVS